MCKLEHRCWRARGEDVSLTDVKIKILKSGCDQGCEWRHAPEAWVEDLGIFEKVSRWELDSEREGSTFGARWGQTNLCTTGATRVWGGGADREASIERSCISLPYVETFNSKVIKSFVPELRSRYVFFRVSGFLCSMYICYEYSMYVSHISNGYVTLFISCVLFCMVCLFNLFIVYFYHLVLFFLFFFVFFLPAPSHILSLFFF